MNNGEVADRKIPATFTEALDALDGMATEEDKRAYRNDEVNMALVHRQVGEALGPSRASQTSFLDMDVATEDIHGKYFIQHKHLKGKIGRYLHANIAELGKPA